MAAMPPASPDASPRGSVSEDGDAHPGMPRWVEAAIAVVLVLVVVLVIGRLTGVEHGPGLHGGDGQTPASQVSEDGATPPAGVEGHQPPPGVEHGQP